MRARIAVAAAALMLNWTPLLGDVVPPRRADIAPETPVRVAPIPASAWMGLVMVGGIVVAGVIRRRTK